jgi:hypothetical protein
LISRRLHGLPLAGAQAVGVHVRRRGENERQRERAGTSVVEVHERHLILHRPIRHAG